FLGDSPECGEEPVLVVIAAADRKAQPIDARARRRRGLRAAGLARFVAGVEAIPVLAARLEARDLDVHAVTELGPRDRRPFLHDGREARIARDLPVDVDGHPRHAAALERLRPEPRREHGAGGPRPARCDAEPEWRRVEAWP